MQSLLFDTLPLKTLEDFPDTRYQGSKLKVVFWIWDHIKSIDFNSVLDAFGGTGCISYLFKINNKVVAYNDILKFNYQIGKALIENDKTKLTKEEVDYLLAKHSHIKYKNIVTKNFKDVYFTDEENKWVDIVIQNISSISNCYKKCIALFALYQACIIKRPYNLFHRKNLYIRFQNVNRTFGNKITWDTSFEAHFRKFVTQANNCIFDNKLKNSALNKDVFLVSGNYDLVYIDTPYLNSSGVGVDYLEFYHFLEGLADYDKWEEKIDKRYKHNPIIHDKPVWSDKNMIRNAFRKLFAQFKNSILVVSYRSDGIPSEKELFNMMKDYKTTVKMYKYGKYKYVLSKNHNSEEILIVGT
jgi:adenine-specific DNA methylase